MNELDSQVEKVGTKTWHQVDISEEKDSEVVEKIGGPCRGRTYGPLIKSLTAQPVHPSRLLIKLTLIFPGRVGFG